MEGGQTRSLTDLRDGQASAVVSREHILSLAIAEHVLLRPIGRGSYGEVWLARNSMGLLRAVKLVLRQSFPDPKPFKRELSGIRKFEPISRSHEGFVDVLQVGIGEGLEYFYYVMELGDDETSGQTIDVERYSPRTLEKEVRRRGRLDLPDALQFGLALSDALAQLHRHGLVHRDIKPSNIIFVNGVPKLADIGLVADAREARSYVGTEGFIPPEGPGAPQADVYGLGKVLYEVVTGQDRQDYPNLPPDWGPAMPDHAKLLELNEVILQACAAQIGDRYPTAEAMHNDLLVVAKGQSVRRLKQLEARWAQAKRWAALVASVGIIALVVGFQVQREKRIRADSRQRQVGVFVGQGSSIMDAGDLVGALPDFVQALRLDQGDPERERRYRLRIGSILSQTPKLSALWAAPVEVDSVCFSPDGRHVLQAEYYGQARIVDARDGALVAGPFGKQSGLAKAVYGPGGELVAIASLDGYAEIWRARDAQLLHRLEHGKGVQSLAFSGDGSYLVTGTLNGTVRLWSTQSGALKKQIGAHAESVLSLAFSPDGQMFATASQDGSAKLWTSDGEPRGEPLAHPSWVTYVAFSPDGAVLATGCFDRKVRIWALETLRLIAPEMVHRDGVSSVEFSPDGRYIATGSLEGLVRLWSAEDHQPLKPNPVLRQGSRVMHASFSPEGRRLVSSGADGTVRIWDLAAVAGQPVMMNHRFSEDRERFATGTNGGWRVWNTGSGSPVSPVLGATPADRLQLSSDGTYCLLEMPSDQGGAKLQVCETGTGRPRGPAIAVSAKEPRKILSFSGDVLVSWGDTSASVWETRAGRLRAQIPVPKADGLALSAPGQHLAIYKTNTVRVIETLAGKEAFPSLVHALPVFHVAFNPDGSRLVTCTSDSYFAHCEAQVWDTASGRKIGKPLLHNDGVLSACFSPRGRYLATASEDFTARIWDVSGLGELVATVSHDDQVRGVAFSGDEQWLLTCSADRTARIWSTDTGQSLTPPLRHRTVVLAGGFLKGDRGVVTSDGLAVSWKWELPLETKSIEDLGRLTYLLTNDPEVRPPEVEPRGTESLVALFRSWGQKHGSTSRATAEQSRAWHRAQAEESELHRHWFGAVFHLEQLANGEGGSAELETRLQAARLAAAKSRPHYR